MGYIKSQVHSAPNALTQLAQNLRQSRFSLDLFDPDTMRALRTISDSKYMAAIYEHRMDAIVLPADIRNALRSNFRLFYHFTIPI